MKKYKYHSDLEKSFDEEVISKKGWYYQVSIPYEYDNMFLFGGLIKTKIFTNISYEECERVVASKDFNSLKIKALSSLYEERYLVSIEKLNELVGGIVFFDCPPVYIITKE